jgi:hypothetical protein
MDAAKVPNIVTTLWARVRLDQLKEVWDIDRATGRGLVIAYLIEERRTVFIRREALCELPEAISLLSVPP